jgi:hypothetical protein
VIPAGDLVCRDEHCDNFGYPGEDICTPEHFPESNGPFRDGRLWVLDDKCSDCIFRPGNLMHLDPGIRDDMVAQCLQRQAPIPCHQTLAGPRSVCRGFYDVHQGDILPIKLAQAMGIVEFDQPPTHHTLE